MRKTLLLGALAILLGTVACRENNRANLEEDGSEATVASETGKAPPLPADVLIVAKPLISGQLYSKPNFESASIASFDTTQQIYILDTTDAIFVKARIRKDTSSFTGYVSRAILPEQK